MENITRKVIDILYNHQWGRDLLLTIFKALRFFWPKMYNAVKDKNKLPPVDWYPAFYNAGNLNWEVMDAFDEQQKEWLRYFCEYTAGKFGFYDSDDDDDDEDYNNEPDDSMADAEALASAGWGTDEDY